MQKDIIQQLRKYITLSDQDVLVFNKYVEIGHFNKKEYLTKEGRVCKQLYYVEKGCLRMFFINKKGVEQITQFALDGWWISDYESLWNDTPSGYSIQAIEKSRILIIDECNLDALFAEIPQLERYFRVVMQRMVAGAQHRSRLLYEMSKEEFYYHFSATFPEFMLRVPQYMIASYLGLTPEYLSELRKKAH